MYIIQCIFIIIVGVQCVNKCMLYKQAYYIVKHSNENNIYQTKEQTFAVHTYCN